MTEKRIPTGEQVFVATIDRDCWAAVRETFRPLRGQVSMIMGPMGTLMCKVGKKRGVVGVDAGAIETMALRYEPEDATALAEALSAKLGMHLEAVDAYDYVKAREHRMRRIIAELQAKAPGKPETEGRDA